MLDSNFNSRRLGRSAPILSALLSRLVLLPGDETAWIRHQHFLVRTGLEEVIDVSRREKWCLGRNWQKSTDLDSLDLFQSKLLWTLRPCDGFDGVSYVLLCHYTGVRTEVVATRRCVLVMARLRFLAFAPFFGGL